MDTPDSPDPDSPSVTIVVSEAESGMRLDSLLVARLPEFSRAKIQRAVIKGNAKHVGRSCKSSLQVSTGQEFVFELPAAEATGPVPEDIPLDIVYEDDEIIGINKPPAMVVHPAKGHWSGTLTAALAFHFAHLSTVGGEARPGIVHRLDRDTSGIILVAKTDQAHRGLAMQFERRTVEKKYWAIVSPGPDRDRDKIDQPIGVHPWQREKMAIRADHRTSRPASSFYEVLERCGRFALLEIAPKTGRTHQIRVHLAHVGSPVLCDRLYSGRSRIIAADIAPDQNDQTELLSRQALHARSIRFLHPISEQPMLLQTEPPADMQGCWSAIQVATR